MDCETKQRDLVQRLTDQCEHVRGLPIERFLSFPPPQSLLSMPSSELVARYSLSTAHFDQRVFRLSDEQLDTVFVEGARLSDGRSVGRWSVRVLIAHLADAELSYVNRMRRIVGEDNPVLQDWDENAFISNGLYGHEWTPKDLRQPISGFVSVLQSLRMWTTGWLSSLEPEVWQRKGMHTVRGEQSLKDLVAYDTWHIEHHAEYLNAKVEGLLGKIKE